MSENSQLRRTALFDWHVANGGRMVDFAGWELPVFYDTGALAEHHGTRSSVGLFDIDHMGQIEVSGPDSVRLVDSLVTSDLTSLEPSHARYGLLCADDGGVLDDVIVYRTGPERCLVVVNASNRESDLAWILDHAASADASVVDRSDELEMIAVQGPNAVELVGAATGEDIASMDRFTSQRVGLFGMEGLLGRTGYTGEDGVELYLEGGVVDVWSGLLELADRSGIEAMAVGLSARDSLRFEPGYPLYGHELSEEINPFEARLGWAVDLDGVEFIGRDALRTAAEQGVDRRLETIVLTERGVPREGSVVVDQSGAELGAVVSGMYAPTADVFAANAFLPRTHGAVGTELAVDIRGKAKAAIVARRPLYRVGQKPTGNGEN